MFVTILGKLWRLRFVRPMVDSRGQCDPPWRRRKAIRVDKTLRDEERLEVLLHEFLHAAFWWIDEEIVADFARDLARVLWRLGYRDKIE